MRGRGARLLLGLLLPGPSPFGGTLHARPAPDAAGDPHVLARAVLERTGTVDRLDRLLAAQRLGLNPSIAPR